MAMGHAVAGMMRARPGWRVPQGYSVLRGDAGDRMLRVCGVGR
jgi:hypothetical protein